MTSKFSKPQVAPQGQSFAHNVKWRLISMFDKNINHGKLFVGITKIKGKWMTSRNVFIKQYLFPKLSHE